MSYIRRIRVTTCLNVITNELIKDRSIKLARLTFLIHTALLALFL